MSFVSQMYSQFGKVEGVPLQPTALLEEDPENGRLPAVWQIAAGRNAGKAEILIRARLSVTCGGLFALLFQDICEL
jgi:hypothetical protein